MWACRLCPCLVKDLTDDDLLSIQIQANALRPETTPMEYARQIRRIMEARPDQLWRRLATASSCTRARRGSATTLGAAAILQQDFQVGGGARRNAAWCPPTSWPRIPHKFQPQFFDAARTMPVAEFRAMAQAFLKQFQEAVRQGKLDAFFTEDFKPQAYMRPLKEVLRRNTTSPSQAALVLAAENCKTLADGLARRHWRGCMHLDRDSIEASAEAVMNRNRKRKEPPDKQP